MTFIKVKYCVVFIFWVSITYGQRNLGQYSFVSQYNIIDAKTVARGGINLAAFSTNVSDIIQNPARIFNTDTQNLFVNYSPFIDVYNAIAMGYAYRDNKEDWKNFVIGLKIFDFGPLKSFDRAGYFLGQKALQDYMLSFGTTLENTGKSNINLGFMMHWLTSYWVDDWRAAMVFDVSAFYQNKQENVNIALLVKGVGFGIKNFNNYSEAINLPIDIQLESAFKLLYAPFVVRIALVDLAQLGSYDKSLIGLGVDKARSNSLINQIAQHTVLGIDYIPKKILTLHLSYGFRYREYQLANVTGLTGISIGGTLHLPKIELTYSKQFFGSYGSSNHINLAYKI